MRIRPVTIAALAGIVMLLAVAFWGAVASAPAATPTREEVTAAITRFEKQFTGPESKAAGKTIRAFTAESTEMVIHLTEKTFPWDYEKWTVEPEAEKEIRTVLYTAYAAANIRSQLAAGKKGDDPHAGWLMVFKAYRELRVKHPSYTSPAIEKLEKMEKEGTLKEYAAGLPLPGK